MARFWSMVLAAVYQYVGTMSEGCPEGVTGVTSLHLRLVLGRDSNKELSSIQAKGISKGL